MKRTPLARRGVRSSCLLSPVFSLLFFPGASGECALFQSGFEYRFAIACDNQLQRNFRLNFESRADEVIPDFFQFYGYFLCVCGLDNERISRKRCLHPRKSGVAGGSDGHPEKAFGLVGNDVEFRCEPGRCFECGFANVLIINKLIDLVPDILEAFGKKGEREEDKEMKE